MFYDYIIQVGEGCIEVVQVIRHVVNGELLELSRSTPSRIVTQSLVTYTLEHGNLLTLSDGRRFRIYSKVTPEGRCVIFNESKITQV